MDREHLAARRRLLRRGRLGLRDATFGGARLPGVLLHGSTLDAVRDAAALRGARISADQVVPLGAAILATLDIAVVDPPPE